MLILSCKASHLCFLSQIQVYYLSPGPLSQPLNWCPLCLLSVILNLIKRFWQLPTAYRKIIQYHHLPIKALNKELSPSILILLSLLSPMLCPLSASPPTSDASLFLFILSLLPRMPCLHIHVLFIFLYQLKCHLLSKSLPEDLNQKLSHISMKPQSTVLVDHLHQ